MGALSRTMVGGLLALFFVVVHGAGGMMVGGFSEHDLLSLSRKETAQYTKVSMIATELMSKIEPVKFSRLISVATQVVAGINYDLKLEVLRNGKKLTCHVLVSHMTPWIKGGTWSVSAQSPDDPCADVAPPPGGKKKLDPKPAVPAEVEKAALWAVDEINKMSNSLYRHGLKEISDFMKEDGSGSQYRFRVTMVPTTCRNNKENLGKTLEECPLSTKGKGQQCQVTVMDDGDGKFSLKDQPLCMAVEKKPESHSALIGGGDHDYQAHGSNQKREAMIGAGDHDYKQHGKLNNLLGGDDHDYKPHVDAKKLIGGGDHDYMPHGDTNNLIGGGKHDYMPHGDTNNLIGGGKHDYIPHGVMNKQEKSQEPNLAVESGFVHQMKIGGDGHDNVPETNIKCQEHLKGFRSFKTKHNKVYSDMKEENFRFQVFCDNMEKVKELQRTELGTAVYGATQFADLTEEEFKKGFLGFNPKLQTEELPKAKIPDGPIPESWDWRDHGAVTPVKNQGYCGSCWAFSTTGNIEGQYAIHHKKLLSLSEQELIDCDKLDQGCNGGFPSNAYKAIMKLGGIETEKDYKYEGEDEKCKFDKSEVAVKLNGAVNISKNEDEMAAWLYHNGPISIGINSFAMQFYFWGISHPWKMFCSPSYLDHGVLIVGYGKEGNEPYWIIKNSWGSGWGRKGYYYVYRGDGTCGLNTMCTSATVV